MKSSAVIILLALSSALHAQELYVSTEPASNMPAKSIGLRLNNYLMPPYSNIGAGVIHTNSMFRFNPELMWGISKNSMLHFNFYMSNMHQAAFKFEGSGLYFKYRFLSIDNSQRHFRMAAYAKGALINNAIQYNELNIGGDNTGITTGIIVTQLIHKLALSFTAGYIAAFDNINDNFLASQPQQSINYSLSGGYLLFPFKYKNYDQPNVNIYAEFLGKYNPETKEQFIDFAPAIQFIFKSKMRLDIAYRRQISGNMLRINNQEFVVKFEYNIFNAYQKKTKE